VVFTPSNIRSFARVYTEQSERAQDNKEKVNMMIRNGKQNHVTGVILNEVKNFICYIREGEKFPLYTPPKG